MVFSDIVGPLAGIVIGVGLIIFAIVLVRLRLRSLGDISHSLGLALFRVKLPRAAKAEGEKATVADLREKIALMEQVLAQLVGIRERGVFRNWFYGKPFFALEIAVPFVGQEVSFYVAVPRAYGAVAEKFIEGVYPDAALERVKDYTVFHPESFVAVAVARAKRRCLPLKTYQTLEADPLGSILNAFSRVTREGEGLAFQIVAEKAPPKWNHHLSKIAHHLKGGTPLHEAVRAAEEHGMAKAFKGALRGGEKSQAPDKDRGPVDEELLEVVGAKSRKPLFCANIRIAAAARDANRAKGLLEELGVTLNQFTSEHGNSLDWRELRGRALRKAVYQFSFRVPDRSAASILSTEEIASLIHFPNTILGAPHVSSIKTKTAPAPANLPREGVLLGINFHRGVETPVHIGESDRARHFYIIGQTGTGKTNLMRGIALQDIEAGRGMCFIDPHGDTVQEILGLIPESRLGDVVYFDPGDVARPLGLNMLEYDQRFPEQKTFIVNELLEIFNKLYDMKSVGGPMFEQYFRNAALLVMEDPASGNTLLEINRVMTDKKFRELKLSKTANPLIKTFWKDVAEKAGGEAALQNIVPYISSKFDSFLSNEIMRPIVAQEKSAFQLREIMDGKKILLINLSKGRLGDLNSALIGLIMVGKILMAALSRTDAPEESRAPFYLYIDEFQNVTTNSIASILSEARKYKLILAVAHQFIGQLTEDIQKAVFGNVGNLAAFRIGAEDGEFLEKQFQPSFAASDLINIDNFNCCAKILIGGQTAPAFSMRTLPGKRGDAEVARRAKELSRSNYGRDRREVEEEIFAKFAAFGKPPVPPTQGAI